MAAADYLSLPVRGAWIEIWAAVSEFSAGWSLPVRGAWIEIRDCHCILPIKLSLPVRGAWIEIRILCLSIRRAVVAPRKGSVD